MLAGQTQIKVDVPNGPNALTRYYDTRYPLISGGSMARRSENGKGRGESVLADILIGLPGVIDVKVKRYTVRIKKAKLFDWDEVEPKVIGVLNDSTNPNK